MLHYSISFSLFYAIIYLHCYPDKNEKFKEHAKGDMTSDLLEYVSI